MPEVSSVNRRWVGVAAGAAATALSRRPLALAVAIVAFAGYHCLSACFKKRHVIAQTVQSCAEGMTSAVVRCFKECVRNCCSSSVRKKEDLTESDPFSPRGGRHYRQGTGIDAQIGQAVHQIQQFVELITQLEKDQTRSLEETRPEIESLRKQREETEAILQTLQEEKKTSEEGSSRSLLKEQSSTRNLQRRTSLRERRAQHPQ